MSEKNIFSNLDQHLKKALTYYNLPGLAVAVTYKDKNYVSSSGYQNAIQKTPLEQGHVFHMASVTKLLVSISILQLCEKGLLSLEGRLPEYLPEFEMADSRYKEINLSQMLSHTSGMPDVEDYCWNKPETDAQALMRYVLSEEVKGGLLLWEPGSGKFAYSNIAYEALGAIIAKVSSMTFEDYVHENIFKPLGMTDSSLLTFKRDESELAAPHEKTKDNHFSIVKHYPYNRAHGPSSTLTSNLKDMSIWGRAMIEKKLLTEDSFKKAFKVYGTVPNNNEGICLSWFKRQQNKQILYGHEGTDDGFRASFWICPELEISITVCANLSRAPVKRINREVFDILTNNLNN